jgi:mRNA-degrading endonuclease RelE of RelBE toxin-antitoxin system
VIYPPSTARPPCGYLANRTADVKKLKSPFVRFRLRCGDYRVFFDLKDGNTIGIIGVRHRKEAYRL